ncbi:4Fe-4S ferredoxin [Pelomyxa schiedti]|nr:4Fe-4S ferredoxin [Pelomyxa schiedti]
MPPHGDHHKAMFEEFMHEAASHNHDRGHDHDHGHVHPHDHSHNSVEWGQPRACPRVRPSPWATVCVMLCLAWMLSSPSQYYGIAHPLGRAICKIVIVCGAIDILCRLVLFNPLYIMIHQLVYLLCRVPYIKMVLYMTKFPIFARYWHNVYHSKPVTTEQAKQFITLEKDLPRIDLGERILPFKETREIALKANGPVAAVPCVCRTIGPRVPGVVANCGPKNVCLIFGKLASFAVKGGGKILSKEEAIELLEDQHRRGHVHNVYFKDMFNGFYALCNCCKCCCGGIERMNVSGGSMTSSGFVSVIDSTKCCGCGTCVRTCPFGAIEMKDGRPVVDKERCLGCTACDGTCPKKAISFERDKDKPEPLEISKLVDMQW